jgi:hypothetical protein
MTLKTTQAMQSRVLVGRRYIEHGFLDAAMRLFFQNPGVVEPQYWMDLADKMLERNRIDDAVRVCVVGGVPLPRERLLALGDQCLKRRDTDRAIQFYQTGTADQERWSRVMDVLTSSPGQELRAIELAERYLVSNAPPGDTPPVTLIDQARAPRERPAAAPGSEADDLMGVTFMQRRPYTVDGHAAAALRLLTNVMTARSAPWRLRKRSRRESRGRCAGRQNPRRSPSC